MSPNKVAHSHAALAIQRAFRRRKKRRLEELQRQEMIEKGLLNPAEDSSTKPRSQSVSRPRTSSQILQTLFSATGGPPIGRNQVHPQGNDAPPPTSKPASTQEESRSVAVTIHDQGRVDAQTHPRTPSSLASFSASLFAALKAQNHTLVESREHKQEQPASQQEMTETQS